MINTLLLLEDNNQPCPLFTIQHHLISLINVPLNIDYTLVITPGRVINPLLLLGVGGATRHVAVFTKYVYK